jgi:hypothetical protein
LAEARPEKVATNTSNFCFKKPGPRSAFLFFSLPAQNDQLQLPLLMLEARCPAKE